MSITSLHLPAPIRRRQHHAPSDHARRDRAVELFESGSLRESVCETLAYLLPGTAVPDLVGEPLCFVQGSARVRVGIERDELAVGTVLAALQDGSQATAALRYFLTRMSSTGQLFQPRLRGDSIALEFRDRLALMHPLKLIEVLQRLPVEAYRNDAWLAQQFSVALPDREPVPPLDDDEFARAHLVWQRHWDQVDALMTESRRRRSLRVLDALGSLAVNHVNYALPLFGAVRARLNESADDFTDRDENPNRRDSVLAKCVKDMQQVGADELRACLGHLQYAINPQLDGTPSLLTSMLGGGQRMQATGELRAAGRALEAALELVSIYLYLLTHYSWPEEVEAALRAGLDLASDQPWREVTDLLWEHANSTAQTYGSHGAHDRDDDEAEAADGR